MSQKQDDKQKKLARRVSSSWSWGATMPKRASSSITIKYCLNLCGTASALVWEYETRSLSWQRVCNSYVFIIYWMTPSITQDTTDSRGMKPAWKEHGTECEIFKNSCTVCGNFCIAISRRAQCVLTRTLQLAIKIYILLQMHKYSTLYLITPFLKTIQVIWSPPHTLATLKFWSQIQTDF